jgi:hypothetical protein
MTDTLAYSGAESSFIVQAPTDTIRLFNTLVKMALS